jgi:soluble lytic murein transglycosylase-like protein
MFSLKKVSFILLLLFSSIFSAYSENYEFAVYQPGKSEEYREHIKNFLSKIKVADASQIVDLFITNGDKYKINPVTLAAISGLSSNITGPVNQIPFFGIIPLDPKFSVFLSEFYQIGYDPTSDAANFAKNIEIAAAGLGFFSEVYQQNQSAALLTLFYDPDLIAEAVGSGNYSETQNKILSSVHKIYQEFYSAAAPGNDIKPPKAPIPEPTAAALKLPDPDSEPEAKHTESILDTSRDDNVQGAESPLYEKLKNIRWISLSADQRDEFIKLIIDVTVKTKLSEDLRRSYAEIILTESEENNINPLLLASLIMNESSFKEGIVSTEGKLGLMQLNPADAEYYSMLTSIPWEEAKATDASYNIKFGTAILKLSFDIFDNNTEKAIAAYNFGIKQFISAIKNKEPLPANTIKLPAKVTELQKKWLEVINPANYVEPVASPSPLPTETVELFAPTPEPSPAITVKPIPTPEPSPTIAVKPSPSPSPTPEESVKPKPTPVATITPTPTPKASAVPVKTFGSPDELIKDEVCLAVASRSKCRTISEQLVLFAGSHEVDDLLIAAIAKIRSNFQVGLVQEKSGTYGIFQFKISNMKQVTYRSKVAWGGAEELLDLNYSLRIACKYLKYLQSVYPRNTEAVVSAFISSPESYNKKKMTQSEKDDVKKILAEIKSWKKSIK